MLQRHRPTRPWFNSKSNCASAVPRAAAPRGPWAWPGAVGVARGGWRVGDCGLGFHFFSRACGRGAGTGYTGYCICKVQLACGDWGAGGGGGGVHDSEEGPIRSDSIQD